MIDDSVMFSDDLRASLEKFFRNRRQLFDPQLMRQPSVAAAVGEQHCDFGETARLPVQLSPVAEIRIRRAAPHAAHPPQPPCRADEWNAIRKASRRQSQSGHSVG